MVGTIDPAQVAYRLKRFLPKKGKSAKPGRKTLRKVKFVQPVLRKPASPRGEDTNKRILQELIRIRKLLEEIKNRLG
ncbi:MAG TPA: hypothetical protein ENJ97_02680 [Planctomycetes bacterium]|nr:hypothetical protein [Planctomycetota bacterium]